MDQAQNSEEKISYSDQLPEDISVAIDHISNVTSEYGNISDEKAITWFKGFNEILAKADSHLAQVYNKQKDIKEKAPLKLFLQLCTHLHDEAKRYQCDNEKPKDLSFGDSIRWECKNCLVVLNQIVDNKKKAASRDRYLFVDKVASNMGVYLKNEIPRESEEEADDVYIKRVWEKLQANEHFNDIIKLDLSFQNLHFLPAEVGELTSLQQLNLNGNQLQFLPDSIGKLTELQKLSVSNNLLYQIPVTIVHLKKLEFIDFSLNKLESLPENFGGVAMLKRFNVNYNKITHLCSTFGNLHQLEALYLAIIVYQHCLQALMVLKT